MHGKLVEFTFEEKRNTMGQNGAIDVRKGA